MPRGELRHPASDIVLQDDKPVGAFRRDVVSMTASSGNAAISRSNTARAQQPTRHAIRRANPQRRIAAVQILFDNIDALPAR